MKNTLALLLITFLMGTCLNAQVKIGDNPQNIDPSSVLELESTDKVLVITRVTTAQMNAISPIQGALCYNTELQAVHFYDGTQWVNIGSGGGTGGPLTADPIVNDVSTIVITPTATGDNLEVAPNSISSLQIIDGGINGIDIQDGSIGPGKLQNNSVTEEKLSENSVGAFALDNDNIGVSAFNNDVGYITAGDLDSSVSADANNAIVAGSDGGAYYDDTNLMNDVLDNATAIAADDDQSSSNEIQNPSLTGTVIGLSGTAGTIDIGPLLSAGGSDDQNIGPISLNASNILSIGIENGTAGTIDLSALAGTGGSDNQNLETPTLSAANVLTLNIEDGNPTTIDLSSLASGTGSTELVDGTTLIGDGSTGDRFRINPSATVGQYLRTTAAGVVWDDVAAGGNQNLSQVLAQGTDGGAALIKNILNPVDPQDAATRAYVDAAVISGGGITDGRILIGGAGDVAQQLAINGDATLDNNATLTIAPATITAAKLNDMGATANGDNIQWNTTLNAGTGGWEVVAAGTVTGQANTASNAGTGGVGIVLPKSGDDLPFKSINAGPSGILNVTDDTAENEIEIDIIPATPLGIPSDQILITNSTTNQLEWVPRGGHSGTQKAIFYADEITGLPTTADDNINTNDDGGFYWDTDGRSLGGNTYGALIVGKEAGQTQSNVAKVHILDNFPGFSYALQLQNHNAFSPGRTTGILFALANQEAGSNYGKGGLVYENSEVNARGDFHFLQNEDSNTSNPILTDKAFSIRNNKDIVLYGGIDINGIGLGAAGEVLTSTATGVEWGTAGGGSDNQNIDGSILTGETLTIGIEDGTNQDIDLGAFALETEMTTAITASEALDLDKDITNELQTITSTDNSVTITASGNDFDLSVAGGGTDNQNIDGSILTGETLTIGIEDGTNQDIDLGVFALETEMTTAITASEALDLDKDNTNEIQAVTAADGTIVVSPAGTNDFTVAVGVISGGPSGSIAANSITQGDIDVNAVGPAEIDSDAVSSDEIDDDSIEAIDINTGAVETDEILDGTIMNVDVAAGAAIDGSKITPTFTAQIDATLGMTSGADILMNGFTVVPDYVFQKYFLGNSTLKENYDFISLEEIEAFVKKNHHLPGIKSAYQAQKEGSWNLSDSNLQNLEKIEELFLHTIEQENKIKALQSENGTLKEELESIKKSIEEIKSALETKE